MYKIISLAVLLAVMSSCASSAGSIQQWWTPDLFFKNAQESLDDNKYKDALYYFNVFLIRYPEDRAKIIAAEYEIASIHFKLGRLKSAESQFKAILDKYDNNAYAYFYPPRFQTLSKLGLQNIEKYKKVNGKLFWRVKEKQWYEEHNIDIIDKEARVQ